MKINNIAILGALFLVMAIEPMENTDRLSLTEETVSFVRQSKLGKRKSENSNGLNNKKNKYEKEKTSQKFQNYICYRCKESCLSECLLKEHLENSACSQEQFCSFCNSWYRGRFDHHMQKEHSGQF